ATWTMRALLTALTAWVRDGELPPPSSAPRIADGTLVPADAVHFPAIPANEYGGVRRPAVNFRAETNALHPLDRGPDYDPAHTTGTISIEPPRISAGSYNILVPQVDADGNDLAGIRDVYAQVPIGTYAGWNLFRPDWFGEGLCSLAGSFVPFATTLAERQGTGDPRLSLQERYPAKQAYAEAIRSAAERLVRQRFMLPEDAERVVAESEANGVRTGP
ncbi:MAG: hypothetical protein JO110_11295, partial [Acetobacteraceae bacterium]|nr:hypothetical protein [Acetobacteraceae bacterium]